MSKKIVQRETFAVNPETNEAVWFYPGNELPGWAEDLVTNPEVFTPRGEEGEDSENIVIEDSKATDYTRMNIAQLDELLEERGLNGEGKKQDKIDRLKAHDGATG